MPLIDVEKQGDYAESGSMNHLSNKQIRNFKKI